MRALLLGLAPVLVVGLRRAEQPSIPDASDMGAFQSDDGMYCGQSDSRTIEGALALKKSGVHGKGFMQAIAFRTSCAALNYSFYGGEDVCYPGVQTWFRSGEKRAEYAMVEAHFVGGFAAKHSISKAKSALLAACSCHPRSIAMRSVEGRCSSVENVTGSWVHHHPTTGDALACVEGPYRHAVYSLASLKSSVQLPMHLFDQVQAFPCTNFGFTTVYEKDDHCYPRMHLWSKTAPIGEDKSLKECSEVEDSLFTGDDFATWAISQRRNVQVLKTSAGCNCLPDSEVGMQRRNICSSPGHRPPINDWWVA